MGAREMVMAAVLRGCFAAGLSEVRRMRAGLGKRGKLFLGDEAMARTRATTCNHAVFSVKVRS